MCTYLLFMMMVLGRIAFSLVTLESTYGNILLIEFLCKTVTVFPFLRDHLKVHRKCGLSKGEV